MRRKVSRKQSILQALASELEKNPGARITTASLARAVGVSEAALYRHFPSKAKMLEALIAFAEESIFVRINKILLEERATRKRLTSVVYLLLAFATRNPGITRVLLGDALVGETERLLGRVDQFFARIESQLKQILRETQLRADAASRLPPELAANLVLNWVEGRMHQFLRSRYRVSPLVSWEPQWNALELSLFEQLPEPPSGRVLEPL